MGSGDGRERAQAGRGLAVRWVVLHPLARQPLRLGDLSGEIIHRLQRASRIRFDPPFNIFLALADPKYRHPKAETYLDR